MRRFLSAFLILCAFPAAAVEVPAADGWYLTSGFTGGPNYESNNYLPKTTPPVLQAGAGATAGMHGEQAIYLKGKAIVPTMPISWQVPGVSLYRYGAMHRSIPMEEWRGKRVRLSLRTREEGARAWLMATYGDSLQPHFVSGSAFRSYITKPGPGGWKTHQLVFDVPAGMRLPLLISMGLIGEGTAWVDDLRIEAVGDDVQKPSRCPGAGLCWQTTAES